MPLVKTLNYDGQRAKMDNRNRSSLYNTKRAAALEVESVSHLQANQCAEFRYCFMGKERIR